MPQIGRKINRGAEYGYSGMTGYHVATNSDEGHRDRCTSGVSEPGQNIPDEGRRLHHTNAERRADLHERREDCKRNQDNFVGVSGEIKIGLTTR